MINPNKPNFDNTPASSQRCGYGYKPASFDVEPITSIITPFYNSGEIFYETAKSVFNQSFQQWEWIIVNDASDDPVSLKILEEFRHMPRIKVIDLEKNSGPSVAKNLGVAQSRTKYITLLDSDDLLEPTAIEKWLWYLECFPECSFVDGYSVGFGAQQYLWPHGFHTGKKNLRENLIDYKCTLKTDVFQITGGFDESNREGGEDWELWLKCAAHGLWGDTIPEYLSWYRRRPTHTDHWNNFTPQNIKDFKMTILEKYTGLEEKFPDIHIDKHKNPNRNITSLPFSNNLEKTSPNILMVLPWMVVGGADRFNLNLIKELIGKDYKISVATTLPSVNQWGPVFAELTPDIFVMDNFLSLSYYPLFIRYLIQSRQIDYVLISNSVYGYQLIPYIKTYFPEITILDYNHSIDPYWLDGGFPKLAVDYQALIDTNIVASQQVCDWMVEKGAVKDKIEVCYVNVESNDWAPDDNIRKAIRNSYGYDQNIPVILYAARIYDVKQPIVFAKTMLELKKRGLKFKSIVLGDGPDFANLRSFINANHLNDVVLLLGEVSIDTVKDFMRTADIFFLPSKSEGIALSIYEAMACGLVAVSSDVGGQRELVIPETGFLIQCGDESQQIESYSQIITYLIENPETMQKMGLCARQRIVANFDISQMGEKMHRIISRLHKGAPVLNIEAIAILYGRLLTEVTVARVDLDDLWQYRGHLLDELGNNKAVLSNRFLIRYFLKRYFHGLYLFLKRLSPKLALKLRALFAK